MLWGVKKRKKAVFCNRGEGEMLEEREVRDTGENLDNCLERPFIMYEVLAIAFL